MTIPVAATVGPFGDTQCGQLDVAHIATVRPLARGAATVVAVTPLPVSVVNCKAPAAAAMAAGDVAISPRDAYSWKLSLSHSASSPLVIKRSPPVKVMFVAHADREAGARTAEVAGKVVLEAAGDEPVQIESATVRQGCW